MRCLRVLILVACMAAGGQAAPAAPLTAAPATAAQAFTFTGVLHVPSPVADAANLEATLDITNHGKKVLELRRGALEIAMFAVEVLDANGQHMPTASPPVPSAEDAEIVRVKPGETIQQHYALHMFSPELKAGTYTVRCTVVDCAPVTVVIQKGK